jgi:preprotein translocase subunit SecD
VADLKDAYVVYDQFNRPVVGFELRGDAADRFYDFTSANIQQPMSILIDKQVISSPVIQDAISDTGTITGPNAAEVNDLVIQLKAGALSVPLTVVQSRTVGPTLGQDSLDKSLVAGIVGLAIVGLFMILYYRLPGVLSVVALVIYTLLTFAVFKLLSVTLTLAGIAGFILSIGMAVDANVLIFARLKEELRSGRPLASAIEAGFDHAWPSIPRLQRLVDDHRRHPVLVRAVHRRQHHHRLRADALPRRRGLDVHRDHGHPDLPAAARRPGAPDERVAL